MTWASLDREAHDPEAQALSTVVVHADDTQHDVSFVAYARAGIEILLPKGLTIGATVRYANDQFDFGSAGGLDADEALWMLTIGSRL